jgi:hypothetical protein
MSIFDYMVIIWGNASKQCLSNVDRCIRRTARYVLHKTKYDSVSSDICNRLKWFSPLENYKYRALCVLYNLIYMKNIPYFHGSIVRNSEIHSHSIRNSFDVHISNIARNQYGSRSFFFKACGLWNDLPEAIKCTQSFPSFKILLRRHILNSLT